MHAECKYLITDMVVIECYLEGGLTVNIKVNTVEVRRNIAIKTENKRNMSSIYQIKIAVC